MENRKKEKRKEGRADLRSLWRLIRVVYLVCCSSNYGTISWY